MPDNVVQPSSDISSASTLRANLKARYFERVASQRGFLDKLCQAQFRPFDFYGVAVDPRGVRVFSQATIESSAIAS